MHCWISMKTLIKIEILSLSNFFVRAFDLWLKCLFKFTYFKLQIPIFVLKWFSNSIVGILSLGYLFISEAGFEKISRLNIWQGISKISFLVQEYLDLSWDVTILAYHGPWLVVMGQQHLQISAIFRMYGPIARRMILLVACIEGVLNHPGLLEQLVFRGTVAAHSKMLACTYHIVLNEISFSVRPPSPLRDGNSVARSVATVLPLETDTLILSWTPWDCSWIVAESTRGTDAQSGGWSVWKHSRLGCWRRSRPCHFDAAQTPLPGKKSCHGEGTDQSQIKK